MDRHRAEEARRCDGKRTINAGSWLDNRLEVGAACCAKAFRCGRTESLPAEGLRTGGAGSRSRADARVRGWLLDEPVRYASGVRRMCRQNRSATDRDRVRTVLRLSSLRKKGTSKRLCCCNGPVLPEASFSDAAMRRRRPDSRAEALSPKATKGHLPDRSVRKILGEQDAGQRRCDGAIHEPVGSGGFRESPAARRAGTCGASS